MTRASLLLAAVATVAVPTLAQQASINLKNSDVQYCNKQDVQWELTKTANKTSPVPSPTEVTYTVTATKGALGNKEICAIGYVEVTNAGSAPATIGNIVVNLQRQRVYQGQNR